MATPEFWRQRRGWDPQGSRRIVCAPSRRASSQRFAGWRAGPIHIHAAEQTREVDDCLAWSGARPVQWLLDNAPVDARWCLVHATHMLPGETERLARSGAVAGLCPVTEANLGDGIFDGPGWLTASGRYGVGTDSNVAISAALELQQLEASQRLGRRARNVMAPAGRSTGHALFQSALAGGAAALGVAAGQVAPGAPPIWWHWMRRIRA